LRSRDPDRKFTLHARSPAPLALEPRDFIREIVLQDLKSGKHDHVVTRFPPEPNGYLHIGHAKAFCLDFGLALEVPGSRCHLRMDDTNPVKEDVEYVESIQEDVRWMGFEWGKHFYYASDYYEQLYGYAVELIKKGLAYVDELSADQMREYRGNLTEPRQGKPVPQSDHRGKPHPLREDAGRRIRRRRRGPPRQDRHGAPQRDHARSHPLPGPQGASSPHGRRVVHLPDVRFRPPAFRCDRGITHSLCSLEFENHRPLYDWFVNDCSVPAKPRQIEFARLNLTYTVMSKRKLQQLVTEKLVDGWDDPRMPTLSGMRRRGYTPEAIRKFIETIGMTKFTGLTDVALLEHAVRNDLNATAPRVMAVLDPIKVVVTSYPEGEVEEMEALINPEDPSLGTRIVPFSRELYIERDDFMANAPKNYFRLTVGQEVRLRYGYWIKCTEVIKDADGNVTELRCTHDPLTRGGENPPDGRKVKGTIHWVSAAHAFPAEVRLYDRLFTVEQVGDDFTSLLNPDSLKVIPKAMLEPSLAKAKPGDRVQFERIGYFCVDTKLSKAKKPVFNRTVALKDTWARQRG